MDDLPETARDAMVALEARLARPGARLFLFAFAGAPDDLPRFSFSGPSRAFPGLLPGEVERRFGAAFEVETIDAPTQLPARRYVAAGAAGRRPCLIRRCWPAS